MCLERRGHDGQAAMWGRKAGEGAGRAVMGIMGTKYWSSRCSGEVKRARAGSLGKEESRKCRGRRRRDEEGGKRSALGGSESSGI